MKQFSLATLSLLCAAVSPLCAEGMMRHNRGQPNCTPKKKPPKVCCPSQECFGEAYNPPAGAKAHNCVNPFFTAEFILWKAHLDGLDYAYSGVASSASPIVSVEKGKVFQPGHKYEPGFKVGAGLKFHRGSWDLYANYTWLHVKNSNDTDSHDDDEVVQANLFLPSFPNAIGLTAEEASSDWHLRFNVVDLELGRDFYNSKHLTFRPHFGFKFAWMKQKFDVEYNDIIGSGTTCNTTACTDPRFPVGADVEIDFKQRQFGVGLRTGFDSAWLLSKHFSIFGDLALTGMWNHFSERRKDEVETLAGVEYNTFNIKDSLHVLSFVLEFAIGLRFEYAFNCDKNLLLIQAGWEQQFWVNQNQLFRAMSTSSEDLTFQGLTAKVGFAF